MPCDLPDGQTTLPSGLEAHPASHSALPGRTSGETTPGTSPPIFSTWSGPAAPTCCSASRSPAQRSSAALQARLNGALQARLNGRGSTIYASAWKQHTTPLGAVVFRLRASARRTSGKGSSSALSGWPTPTTRDHKDGASEGTAPINGLLGLLGRQVWLAGWPTPTKGNADGSQSMATMTSTGRRQDGSKGTVSLPGVAATAGWPTPRSADAEKNVRTGEGAAREIERKGGPQDLMQGALIAGWPTPQAGTPAQNGHSGSVSTDSGRKTMAMAWGRVSPSEAHLYPVAVEGPARITADGRMLTGSSAGMDSGGRLNPAHSRWLMGYPPEWDDCAVTAMPSSRKSHSKSLKASDK